MTTLTFGRFVTIDRHNGVCICANDATPDFPFSRRPLLANCEALLVLEAGDFETLIGLVARHLGAPIDETVGQVCLASTYLKHPLVLEHWHGTPFDLDIGRRNEVDIQEFFELIKASDAKAKEQARIKRQARRAAKLAAAK